MTKRDAEAFLENFSGAASRIISAESSNLVLATTSVFRLLLLVPLDYLSWTLVNETTSAAFIADKKLCTQHCSVQVAERIVLLRIFLRRVYSHAGVNGMELEQVPLDELLLHFIKQLPELEGGACLQERLEKATLDLAEVFLVCVRV